MKTAILSALGSTASDSPRRTQRLVSSIAADGSGPVAQGAEDLEFRDEHVDLRSRLQRALGQRYQISRELGRGATAVVFLATDVRHQRQVALKVLVPDLYESAGEVQFAREIQLLAGLHHPNILPLFDSGCADDLQYFVAPYASGGSLRQRLASHGPLGIAEAARIASDIADALEHAHQHGVIHRDVKPGNIFLAGGRGVLGDFGIAKPTKLSAEALTETLSGAPGTPLYMSPEQPFTATLVDGRSDIYSLGLVLYEMLAGELPFQRDGRMTAHGWKYSMDAPPLSSVRAEIPATLERTVARALKREPADRFATAGELATVLSTHGGRGAWSSRESLDTATVTCEAA